MHIKELCFRFAALAVRFKETLRHELCSVPAFTFSSFGIILRKVPAAALCFSFLLLKTNIWEIDHFSVFHTFSSLCEDYFYCGQIKSAGNEDFITDTFDKEGSLGSSFSFYQELP